MASIQHAFEKDHDKLHLLFSMYTEKANSPEAIDAFNEVANALRNHIRQEEEIYKLIENKSNELDRTIIIIRQQHTTIRNILNELQDITDVEELHHRVEDLQEYLQQHEKLEEKTLYKMADELLPEDDREIIIAQL